MTICSRRPYYGDTITPGQTGPHPDQMTDQRMKLRHLLCNYTHPHSVCDCWNGENCPHATPLAPMFALEVAIMDLFIDGEQKR